MRNQMDLQANFPNLLEEEEEEDVNVDVEELDSSVQEVNQA